MQGQVQRNLVLRKLAPGVAPVGERRSVEQPGTKLYLSLADAILIYPWAVAELDCEPWF